MKYDQAIETIAEYVDKPPQFNKEAYQTAIASLADSLGCAILALKFPKCTNLLGPIVPNTSVPNGSRIPGTDYILDPVLAAFNIGAMIRWLDYNDTWLAAEWAHPSDNLGGILALSDYLSQKSVAESKNPLTIQNVLENMIMAYEIQGGMALKNSFNKLGLDHVILVKLATAAVATKMLGGSKEQIMATISNCWIDTGPLRTYRHAPNTGSRKSWAAGDATRRGVELALLTMRGEMGYSSALSAKKWGFYDVVFKGNQFEFQRPLSHYVMENILYKISFPAEFHAQTAVEASLMIHEKIKIRLDEIEKVEIITHDSAMRIINKEGPLHNPADRDHCLQYMVAIALLFGRLTAHDYEDETAADPRVDELRKKMIVKEDQRYSIDYHDPDKRSIANSITVILKDGTSFGPIEVEYPIGHRRRRHEGMVLLFEKFENNLLTHYSKEKTNELISLFKDEQRLASMPVNTFMDLFVN